MTCVRLKITLIGNMCKRNDHVITIISIVANARTTLSIYILYIYKYRSSVIVLFFHIVHRVFVFVVYTENCYCVEYF